MRLAVPLCLACGALLTVACPTTGSARAVSSSYPHLAAHAAAPEGFVPAGWQLWEIKRGDLNKDGISDAVLILNRGKGDDAYRLVVVFANPTGGFDLAADNNKILAGVSKPSTDSETSIDIRPDSDGLKVSHGVFKVQITNDCPGAVPTITFTFRYQDGRFVLIGYDYHVAHFGFSKISFNLLNGQIVWTTGSTYEDGDGADRKRVGTFPLQKPISLDTIGPAFDFDSSFSAYKYLPRDWRR